MGTWLSLKNNNYQAIVSLKLWWDAKIPPPPPLFFDEFGSYSLFIFSSPKHVPSRKKIFYWKMQK